MNKIPLWKRLIYILLTLLLVFIVGYLFHTGGNVQ